MSPTELPAKDVRRRSNRIDVTNKHLKTENDKRRRKNSND